MLRWLRAVHNSGDSGSPRVVDSTNARRSDSNVGSLSVVFLRPPPGRRRRAGFDRAHLRDAAADHAGRHAGRPGRRRDPAVADDHGLTRHEQAARPFRQLALHLAIPRTNLRFDRRPC